MSISASTIKNIRALQQKKFRKESGLFVVEGIKTVEELINSSFELDSIYTTEPFNFLNAVDTERIHIIDKKELDRISGLQSPNKILAVAKIPSEKPVDRNDSLILVLDSMNDPGNIGTIIRTAKWFGVNTILCSEDCADVYDRKVVQSTMGALFHVNIRYENLPEWIDKAKEHGFSIIGAAMNGKSIYTYQKTNKTALLIGSESHGISPTLLKKCDSIVTIPNNEVEQKVESLNAGIAASILLSELTHPL